MSPNLRLKTTIVNLIVDYYDLKSDHELIGRGWAVVECSTGSGDYELFLTEPGLEKAHNIIDKLNSNKPEKEEIKLAEGIPIDYVNQQLDCALNHVPDPGYQY